MADRRFWNTGGPAAPPHSPHPPPEQRPPGPPPGLSGELGRLLGRLAPKTKTLETEDLLLLAVLWLLYRESGDRDFLLALAAYLFL